MKLVTWPDPLLNTLAKPVSEFNDEVTELVQNMFATMVQEGGVGLAANQVGVLSQVLVVDTTVIGGSINKEFINPKLTLMDGKIICKEGCLSFPGVFVSVPRFETIAVEAQDRTGAVFTIVADGIDAICIQHEIDHLAGITFYDRLSPLKKTMHKKKFNNLINQKGKTNGI
jgi:peptide deformylase